MDSGAVQIKYQGFHASDATKSYVENLMNEIAHEGPRGSTMSATFSKRNRIIRGIVRINSWAGPFFGTASGEALTDVIHRLSGQMRKRFDKWKSKRFDHHGLKELKSNYAVLENLNTEQLNLTSLTE